MIHFSPTQPRPDQKQDASNQRQPTSAWQATSVWGSGICPMWPRSWPVFCQLQTPHGRCAGGAAHGHFNCVLGTWSCVGTKPISLGPQTHDRPTLHQELGVSAAPRTSPAAPGWTLGGVPASLPPAPLRESPSRNGTGFAFHPVYGRPSSRGKPKVSRQCRVSARADPPPTEAGTCQGPDTGFQEGSRRHRLRGHNGPLSPSRGVITAP